MRVKKLTIALIALILIITTSIPVLAVANYEVTIEIDKTQLKKGETVKLTISLANINLSDGLGAFAGKLTYDEAVFEKVEQADIVGATGWGSVLYNPEGGYLVVERSAGDLVTTDNEVMVITLKVKENVSAKNAQIEISEISCSNGEEDLTAEDVVAQIAVIEEVVNNGNNTVTNNTTNNSITNNNTTNNSITNNNTTNNSITNNNTTNNSITNNNTTNNNVTNNNTTNNNATTNKATNNAITNKVQNNKVENTPGTSLPHAGASDYIMPVIIIALLAVLISYIHYKKIKDIK